MLALVIRYRDPGQNVRYHFAVLNAALQYSYSSAILITVIKFYFFKILPDFCGFVYFFAIYKHQSV